MPTNSIKITEADINSAQTLLDKAKIAILTRSIFLASISFELRHKISTKVATAATDGLSILYNPLFLLKLSLDETIGLVAHEIWHVAFDHMARREDRDPIVWNMAGDYVINSLLIKTGFTIPEGGLYDPKLGKLATEQAYEKLIKDPPNGGNNPLGDDVRLPGSLTDEHKGGAPGDIRAAQQKTTQILAKAKTATEMSQEAGQIPGEIGRMIDELLDPVLDWNKHLTRFFCDIVKTDYSWKRPNKRFMPNYYLPSQGVPTIGNVICGIDLSGSINQEQLTEIYSEIESIRVTFQPKELTIIGCDYIIAQGDIRTISEFDSIMDLKWNGGGGGTSFLPVMEYCKKNPPSVLLYFTDLYAENLTDEPDFPNLWICYSNHRPQGIGETIYYKSRR